MTFSRLGFGMGNCQASFQLLGWGMGMKNQFPTFGIGNEKSKSQPLGLGMGMNTWSQDLGLGIGNYIYIFNFLLLFCQYQGKHLALLWACLAA